jgi:hypothetical protein
MPTGDGRGLSKLVGGRVSTIGRWRWRRIGSVMVQHGRFARALCVFHAWMDFWPDELLWCGVWRFSVLVLIVNTSKINIYVVS